MDALHSDRLHVVIHCSVWQVLHGGLFEEVQGLQKRSRRDQEKAKYVEDRLNVESCEFFLFIF